MLIVGDIGGTHARFACVKVQEQEPTILFQHTYPSQQASSLQELVHLFLKQCPQQPIEAACFAIPGPVSNGTCHTTNLPWAISAQELAHQCSLPHVFLLNDVEGHAWMLTLKQKIGFFSVYTASNQVGNYALIAPGTGLGEAGLIWNGHAHLPFASEGGHCTFAPKNEEQWKLKTYLQDKWGHVSYERILSGPGFIELYMFYRDVFQIQEPTELTQQLAQTQDQAALITEFALQNKLSSCVKALDCFIAVLADEIGNCALKYMARGGVFLAGGIPHKLLTKLQGPKFLQSYLDKGRLSGLLKGISITVIHDELSCIRGAARYADVHLRGKYGKG